MRNLVKRAIGGVEEAKWASLKPITEWATSPWGQNVPIHIAWFLIWVAALAGLLFLIVHAIYVRYFAKAEEFAGSVSPTLAAVLPPRIPRHSLAARLFHWIMAASMFTLLFTAFLPKVGVQFDWVTYHWIAGSVLTVSILFHIIPCLLLAGLLGDLAGQSRLRGCMEKSAQVYGPAGAAAAEVREVPVREQALPRRDHRDRLVRHRNGRVHDVPSAYDLLSRAILICLAT